MSRGFVKRSVWPWAAASVRSRAVPHQCQGVQSPEKVRLGKGAREQQKACRSPGRRRTPTGAGGVLARDTELLKESKFLEVPSCLSRPPLRGKGGMGGVPQK